MDVVRAGAAGRLRPRPGRHGLRHSSLALGLVSVMALTGGPWASAIAQVRPASPAGTISTVAGGYGGPGQATKIAAASACGVLATGGHLWIAEGSLARRLNVADDRLTTRIGQGLSSGLGPNGDGGPAADAGLITLCGMSADSHGNLVLADWTLSRIRVVAATTGTFYGQKMTAKHIYTVAGGGTLGYGKTGVPARKIALTAPTDVAVDSHGNLVIADSGIQVSQGKIIGSVVQVVCASTGTFYGQKMIAGDIYTVAGSRKLNGYSGDGGPATQAAFNGVLGTVSADSGGNLVLTDEENNRVRVVAAATGTFYGVHMIAEDIYTVAGDGRAAFSGDGGPATSAALSNPDAAALDGAGNLVICDGSNQRVRVVAAHTGMFYGQQMTTGDIYTIAGDGTRGFAGDGGPASSAEFNFGAPGFYGSVATDAAGNLVILDSGNERVRVLAAHTGTFYGQQMTTGDVYTVAGNGQAFSGFGGPAAKAVINQPNGVTAAAGYLAFAARSQVDLVATSAGTFFGQAMTAGDVYRVAGGGTVGYAGDGGPGRAAELNFPGGMAVDASGNLLISDSFNNRVRVVAAHTGTFYGQAMITGRIYTVAGDGTGGFSGDGGPAVAAELSSPEGVSVDASGNLVISDGYNDRVRVVAARTGTFYGQAMTIGDVYTVAGGGPSLGDGGPATSAQLSPGGNVAVDQAGNLVIPDSLYDMVRVVAVSSGTFYGQKMTAGDIYKIAGNGHAGFSGDGGPATQAELYNPDGVALDSAGNVVISDNMSGGNTNGHVRVVAVSTGTFFGQPMIGGNIYTVAGRARGTSLGDGGPATSATLQPTGVAIDAAGDLLISDDLWNRIRSVAG